MVPATIRSALRRLHLRMSGWLYLSAALLVGIVAIAPHQLPVTLYKLSLITTGAWLGYWLDRSLFPYARPHQFVQWGMSPGGAGVVLAMTEAQSRAFSASMLRRAMIISAVVIGVGLGA